MLTLLTIPWFKLEGLRVPGTGLVFHVFGLLVGIALILGVRLASAQAARNGIRKAPIEECALYAVIAGFVLGHIFDVVMYAPESVIKNPVRLLLIWQDLSSFGGVFGGAVGCIYWAKRRGVPLLPVYDCLSYAFPFGWTLGRIGCFVVHDHPGRETSFFLGVANYQYPGLAEATRHDLGLYEVIWAVAVSILFLVLAKKPRAWGFYSALFALLYAPFRFGLDFLRVGERTYAGLTPGHLSSLLTLAFGIALWSYMRRHGRSEIPEVMRLDSKLPWPPGSAAPTAAAKTSR